MDGGQQQRVPVLLYPEGGGVWYTVLLSIRRGLSIVNLGLREGE